MPGGRKIRRAGDYFERRTRAALEADGWVVVRAAGSLGPADLVALKRTYWPRLISCKLSGRMTPHERDVLADAAIRAGANPIMAWRQKPGWVAFTVVTRRHGDEALESLHMPARAPGNGKP